MSLPEITLDDRRFQDLVDEARQRVGEACPEWTEHNVSDPGITLIEAFAWMTEAIVYRLNRVPDKVHVALLDLLGIRLDPPTAATTELRFRLAAPADEPVRIPAAETEVGTVRTASDESIVFQTSEDFTIPPLRPSAYVVERGGKPKNVGVAAGVAEPMGEDQRPFGLPPQVGDALYLGFDERLRRLLLCVDVECSRARGRGIVPDDPPLVWEISTEEGAWERATVLADSTGGFNYDGGSVELELPARSGVATIATGQRLNWVRCRIDSRRRSGGEGGAYLEPPTIFSITAAPIGALLPASHSARETLEMIGESDGTPGQTFRLHHAPVLELADGERLEIRNPGMGRWRAWEQVESFASSEERDRHFMLDLASGEVELGPAIRSADGGWRRYGAVPPKQAELRFTSYRHGGGRRGNVAAGTLTVLKTAIPGVASVNNPVPALGGVDQETLESARRRASMEIRTRYRAVTAEDFEFLALRASPRVARAVCVPPEDGGAVRIHIVPRVQPADRKLEYAELVPDEELLATVNAYLDERRILGTSVQVLPARLRGVSVRVGLEASPNSDLERVKEDVERALYVYLNPIVGGSLTGPGAGWGFGRALNQGELYGVVHSIEGVEYVKTLRVYVTDLATGRNDGKPSGEHIPLEVHELIASGSHEARPEHPKA